MIGRLLVAVGTRPEFVKIAPVLDALRERGVPVHLVATGQHTDQDMAGQFLTDLGIVVDEAWDLGASTGAQRMGLLTTNAFDAVERERPDAVLVLGDTITVPIFALAARALGRPLIHVEAGLRGYNPQSVEEANRRFAGAVASLHFAPTQRARRELLHEGVDDGRIEVTGNPAIDALRHNGPAAVPMHDRRGAVFSVHRPTNVDDPARLAEIVAIVRDLADLAGRVDFPVHPRTLARLEAAGLWADLTADPRIVAGKPVPYAQMLELVAGARLVVTDSGGLQEEASWYGVPAIVLRRSTPRWEGVELGISTLCGVSRAQVHAAATRMLDPQVAARIDGTACPYGDGRAAQRIADRLADPATWDLIALREPDFTDGTVPAR